MSEAKEFLIEVMRDDYLATADRLRAVELLCGYFPETFGAERPARAPVNDGILLYQMLREAYRAGWDASTNARNGSFPCTGPDSDGWRGECNDAILELLERHNHAADIG